jgi:acyl-CoA thioester hydrolase
MIELYRGSANTWECDENGHMNVRFYVARMMEGLAELAAQAQMPDAFRDKARFTLRPRDQHIRFIKEAHAARPFVMTGCVLEVAESSVLVYQQIDHASGEPCATFRTWIDHIDLETGQPFPFPSAALGALEGMAGHAPPELGPRSLDLGLKPLARPLLSDAEAAQVAAIGRGVVDPRQCDRRGVMLPEFFIGRLSDSMPVLLRPWRDRMAEIAMAAGHTVRSGGAVLEYRIVYRRWPRAGDRFVVRSSLAFVKEKVHSFVHWILDPCTGEAWATSQAVAVALNLETRKIIPASLEMQAEMLKLVPAGLSL